MHSLALLLQGLYRAQTMEGILLSVSAYRKCVRLLLGLNILYDIL